MLRFNKAIALFLAVWVGFCCSTVFPPGLAMAQTSVFIDTAVTDTGACLLKTAPKVGSIGGEWAVIGLARSDCTVPLIWYDSYDKNLVAHVQEKKGVLHDRKYTEYSRVILALTAIGKDPANVGGYNLLEKLDDYNKVTWQGINGPIFALIALDSGDYKIAACKESKVHSTRDLLIAKIISRQLPDGGFSLGGQSADPDITAQALQALAPYQNQTRVQDAVKKAINCLSKLQNSDGGYASQQSATSESAAQVIIALTSVGIDPDKDRRFIKSGNSVVDNLMTFYILGGGFKHVTSDSKPNTMATEQGFCSLVAYQRFLNHKKALYDMSDLKKVTKQ